MNTRTRLFRGVLTLALVITLLFLLIPIAALLLQVPVRELPALLRETAVTSALLVSLKTSLIANVLFLAIGTPAAYLMALGRFRGRPLLLTLIELPLVLPTRRCRDRTLDCLWGLRTARLDAGPVWRRAAIYAGCSRDRGDVRGCAVLSARRDRWVLCS